MHDDKNNHGASEGTSPEAHEDDLPDYIFEDDEEPEVSAFHDPCKDPDSSAVADSPRTATNTPSAESAERYFPPDQEENAAASADQGPAPERKERGGDDATIAQKVTVGGAGRAEDSKIRPLILLLAGAVALAVISFGGYKLVTQRNDLQARVASLQSELAEAANPEALSSTTRALENARARNSTLQAEVSSLQQENRQLAGRNSSLLQELENLRKTMAERKQQTMPAKVVATSRADATDRWFINIATFAKREEADEWELKLRKAGFPGSVMPATVDNRTLYRVRVTGLESKADAGRMAGRLEKQFNLQPLWIGKDSPSN